MRIALAQVNPTVGDLSGNARIVIDGIDRAREMAVDLVCFPELVITGYPPEDLLLKRSFVHDNIAQLNLVARATKGISAVGGFVDEEGDIFNASAFLHDGAIKTVYPKAFLPNNGVFAERAYFLPGPKSPTAGPAAGAVRRSWARDGWCPPGPVACQ